MASSPYKQRATQEVQLGGNQQAAYCYSGNAIGRKSASSTLLLGRASETGSYSGERPGRNQQAARCTTRGQMGRTACCYLDKLISIRWSYGSSFKMYFCDVEERGVQLESRKQEDKKTTKKTINSQHTIIVSRVSFGVKELYWCCI